MKKMLPFTLLLLGLTLQGNAQQLIASFGIQQTWGIPHGVSHVIYDDYYGYDWVHAARVRTHGGLFYDVLLQRSGLFVELRIDNFGHIVQRQYLDYYPLHGHICNGFCGYHKNYYYRHNNHCHSHDHYGHNHVVYVRPPQQTIYVYPEKTHVVYKGGSGNHTYNKPSRTVVVEKSVRQSRTQSHGLERRKRYYDNVTRENGHAKTSDHKINDRSSEQTQASHLSLVRRAR